MTTFPPLRVGVLQSLVDLKAAYDANRDLFETGDCPYDPDIVAMLQKIFQVREVKVIKEVLKEERKGRGRPRSEAGLSEAQALEIEDEVSEMLEELRVMAKDESGELKSMDTKTKLDIIKVRTNLYGKLAEVRERFSTARRYADFQRTVVELFEKYVPDEKRGEMLEELREQTV